MEKGKTKIEIYTLNWCPYCRKAKAFFNSKGIGYTEYNIEENDENKQEMIERTDGEKTVPQIFINDQKIGGYDDLISLNNEGKLNEILGLPEKGDMFESLWDLIIIGAGPAGLNAALYDARKGLEVLIISVAMGGQVIDTDQIDNWIGSEDKTGSELIQSFWEHTQKYDVNIELGEKVIDVYKENNVNEVIIEMESGHKAKGKSLLIASGTHKKELGVTGEKRLKGNGVHYCAICDGYLYGGKPVAVVGGGNSGLEAALDMAKLDSKVHLIEVDDKLGGDQILQEKVCNNHKIEIHTSCRLKEIKGEDKVDSLIIRETETGKFERLLVDAVFVEIGLMPNSGFVSGWINLNQRNEIIINERNETNIEGVWAAGDVTDIYDKQIIVSAAEGAKAALRINEYLNE